MGLKLEIWMFIMYVNCSLPLRSAGAVVRITQDYNGIGSRRWSGGISASPLFCNYVFIFFRFSFLGG